MPFESIKHVGFVFFCYTSNAFTGFNMLTIFGKVWFRHKKLNTIIDLVANKASSSSS